MARFNFEESVNYGGGANNFFSLKNDKDVARVRFLINDINDLFGVSCHEVDINGKKVDVECLRTYNEPLEKCPLCQAGYALNAKLFIPVYNEEAQTSQIWTRGKTYFDKMASLCGRYNPLVATSFDIERIGKKGDTNTRYEIYPITTDAKRVTDFPEIQLEGVAFESKTYEEINNYLQTGSFEAQAPTRSAPHAQATRQVPIRRAPVRTNEEAF